MKETAQIIFPVQSIRFQLFVLCTSFVKRISMWSIMRHQGLSQINTTTIQ